MGVTISVDFVYVCVIIFVDFMYMRVCDSNYICGIWYMYVCVTIFVNFVCVCVCV